MSITLALLLAVPLFNCSGPVLTFQDMLDSAQLVVIGKVDSMWYEVDTIFGIPDVRDEMMITARTYVTAEILNAYAKDTSFIPSSRTIHITHAGGQIAPNRFIEYLPSVSFRKGEVFLAAVEKRYPPLNSEQDIYRVSRVEWKYTIADDSLSSQYGDTLSLEQVLQVLPTAFREVK